MSKNVSVPALSNELVIEAVSVSRLTPNPQNARTHPKAQILKIGRLIGRYGQVTPIVCDAEFNLIGGHAILEAIKLRGGETALVTRLSNLSTADKKALGLALNRIGLDAGWDRQVLATTLCELVEAEFEIEDTGFDVPEVDILLEEHRLNADDAGGAEDDVPAAAFDEVPISSAGDVWGLGRHKLVVGDARDSDTYRALLGDERASMSIADPPYNVKISDVVGRGRVKHREFAMGSGEMTKPQYVRFLNSASHLVAEYTLNGGLAFTFTDSKHLPDVLAATEGNYDDLVTLIVWDKTVGGMGGIYRNQHELILLHKVGRDPQRNNVQLGRFGRNRTNVWRYRGLGSFGKDRLEDLAAHPTVKPAAMIADAILDVTRRNDIVLDPFVGSGTTIVACEKTGRRARAIEIDCHYADVAIRRFEQYSGRSALHAETGLTFEDTAEMRRTALLSSATTTAGLDESLSGT